jgi:hypothetical protein
MLDLRDANAVSLLSGSKLSALCHLIGEVLAQA